MKKLLSVLIILALSLALLSSTAFAAGSADFSKYSDEDLKQLYEQLREEMISRGIPLAQETTLRDGKYVVGEDILPGTYTLKCLETFGETYGDLYGALGGAVAGDLGGMMGALGGMMGEVLPAQVEILGDYGAVLKSFEMKTGDAVRITLAEKTALQISDGTCLLIAD